MTRGVRAEREVADRSLAPLRQQYEAEVRALLDAAYRVLRRNGEAGATVAEILSEAHLSTRAFYRHFRSKDELLLALFRSEAEAAAVHLAERLAGAASPRAALEAWVDDVLDLVYEQRRAQRTLVFTDLPRHLALDPLEIDRVREEQVRPLVEVLAAGRASGDLPDTVPDVDARAIAAVLWSVVGDVRAARARPPRAEARAHVLRFALGALGSLGALDAGSRADRAGGDAAGRRRTPPVR